MGLGTGILNYLSYFLMGVVTVTVVSGLATDATLYSDHFMSDEEIKVSSRLDGDRDRFVASANKMAPIYEYLPMDEEGINEAKVNGIWEIYQYINENNESIDKKIRVNLKLTGTSQFRVSEINEFKDNDIFPKGKIIKYYLQIFPSNNTIVLAKTMKNGIRNIYARKISSKVLHIRPSRVKKIFKQNVENAKPITSEVKDESYEEESDIKVMIKNVYHPQKSSKLLEGDLVSGFLTVYRKTVTDPEGKIISKRLDRFENFRATIIYKRDICNIDIAFALLRDGNKFTAEMADCNSGEVSISHGLVVANGKDEFSLLISTGPYQGAAIRFAKAGDVDKYLLEKEERETKQMEKKHADDRESQDERESFEENGFNFDKVSEDREEMAEERYDEEYESRGSPQIVEDIEVIDREDIDLEEMAALNEES